jgi:hypothetical protein
VKSCKLSVTPDLPEGVPWGPVSSYNWNGDFGYWFDEPGVRAREEGPCTADAWLGVAAHTGSVARHVEIKDMLLCKPMRARQLAPSLLLTAV